MTPPSGPAPSGPAADLLAAMSAVRRTARRAVHKTWTAEPLPPARSELLRLVAARPGLSVAEAASELRLAPNTVSTLVSRLVEQGLLKRDRGAPDGRSVCLAATPQGHERLAGYRDLRVELTQAAMANLPPGDMAALAGAVPALRRLAEQLALL